MPQPKRRFSYGETNRNFWRDSAIFSLVVLLLILLAGCGYGGLPDASPQEPNEVSLNPADWYILHGAGMPAHPSTDSEGAWSFDFPNVQAGGAVSYVETPFNATKTPQSVTIVFRVDSDDAQYVVLDPTDIPPATCRLMIEEQNDDFSDPNGRWWADASIYNLGSEDGQTLTFTVPMTSDQWTNVDGQNNAQAFSDFLRNIGWVGVTFGGQYFAGHGVAISGGSATYTLIGYTVN